MTQCITHNQTAQTGVWAKIVKHFKTKAQQRQNRAAFQHMLALDPHILKDIGVTRGDVIWANSLPIELNAAKELQKATNHRPMRVD